MVTMTKEKLDSMTPDQAFQMLMEGNKRFEKNEAISRDYVAQREETSTGQYPFATILSCIDSRTSSEIIFDQGIGDLFNVRLAGNVINEDALGSMEFACKVAGSKVIMILGHEACGAVKGACDHVEMGNLTSLLSKITPAVDLEKEETTRDSSNPEFVRKVTEIHTKRMREELLERSPILKEMDDNNEIKIVCGIHDLKSGVVRII